MKTKLMLLIAPILMISNICHSDELARAILDANGSQQSGSTDRALIRDQIDREYFRRPMESIQTPVAGYITRHGGYVGDKRMPVDIFDKAIGVKVECKNNADSTKVGEAIFFSDDILRGLKPKVPVRLNKIDLGSGTIVEIVKVKSGDLTYRLTSRDPMIPNMVGAFKKVGDKFEVKEMGITCTEEKAMLSASLEDVLKSQGPNRLRGESIQMPDMDRREFLRGLDENDSGPTYAKHVQLMKSKQGLTGSRRAEAATK